MTLPPDAQPRQTQRRPLGRVYDRIVEVYAEVQCGTPADKALKNVFRRSRDLGPKERSVIQEAIYAAIRSSAWIEEALTTYLPKERRNFERMEPLLRDRLRLMVSALGQGTPLDILEAQDSFTYKRFAKTLAQIARHQETHSNLGTAPATNAVTNTPSWLKDRLAPLGKESAARTIEGLSGRAPVCVRANPRRISREALAIQLAESAGIQTEPTPYAPHGLLVANGRKLRETEAYRDARFEMQDEGSQIIAELVLSLGGRRILDACAGAGGKSLSLASSLTPQQKLVAIEPDGRRNSALRKRAQKAEVHFEIRQVDFFAPPGLDAGQFDCILVDAPCSGTGVLRRNPERMMTLKESDVAKFASLQTRLLGAALAWLAPGGTLVYSTCSILPEENEDVVRGLLNQDASLRLLSLPTPAGCTSSPIEPRCFRIGPGPSDRDPDGFFIAALRRSPGASKNA
jgi:16S rRNA (cytosine967-C5)-methyltransferase